VSVKKYQQYRDLFPALIATGLGLLLAQLLLAQTIWKKLRDKFWRAKLVLGIAAGSAARGAFCPGGEAGGRAASGIRLGAFVADVGAHARSAPPHVAVRADAAGGEPHHHRASQATLGLHVRRCETQRPRPDLAVDTSRSMLSNDVPPSRLQRVKLAAQDLLDELQGDRVGLIAFAGRLLQAPLTIDYDAAVEAINDLDTTTIPEGGTNISAAIDMAVQTYGKSAIGNRALIIFTDGEELSGDSLATAKTAADAGVRIYTVGVGTSKALSFLSAVTARDRFS